MRKIFLALLFCFLATPAFAQFSRITSIRGQTNTGATAFFAASPFTIKAGANCSWTTVGTSTIHTFNCTSAGTPPGGASGTIQYNNSGAFGGVTGLTNGLAANCDGMGDPCFLKFAPSDIFTQLFTSQNSGGTAGNYAYCYQPTDGGLHCAASPDGVKLSDFNLFGDGTDGPSIDTSCTGCVNNALLWKLIPAHKSMQLPRIYIVSTNTVDGDFVPSGGWGATATATKLGGTDQNPKFEITAGGAGIAANPTVAFTFHEGAFSGGGSAPVAVCNQAGGTGVVADVTYTMSTTVLTVTWHGTPVAASTYDIACWLIQAQ